MRTKILDLSQYRQRQIDLDLLAEMHAIEAENRYCEPPEDEPIDQPIYDVPKPKKPHLIPVK